MNLPNSQTHKIIDESPLNSKKREEKKENVLTLNFSPDDEKVIKLIGKYLVGKSFHNSFLLYKYQIHNDLFRFSNATQKISI